MGPNDYAAEFSAWQLEYTGREDSLDASWALATIEEQWGDSLFFGGAPDSAVHYRAAQRALVPLGALFSSSDENERRMEAHRRLTDKLYAVGPDGLPRPGHQGQPHPDFQPIPPREETKPEPPPAKSITERREAVIQARETRTKRQTALGQLALGQLDDPGNHWRYRDLGDLWLAAARALGPHHPACARRACQWSRHYLELYNRAWTAHLPASRWDSDGGSEIAEVQDLENALPADIEETPSPEWVARLLDGDWQGALAACGDLPPAPEFKPLTAILADACQIAGLRP